MTLEVAHTFSREDARARIEALGDYFANKYNVDVGWSGDRANIKAKYMMLKVDGHIDILDDNVVLEGPDPGRLLRNKATDYLRKKLLKYLDPATALDDLPRR